MESLLWLLRMHWDHEPVTFGSPILLVLVPVFDLVLFFQIDYDDEIAGS
jgi:hypothetical protein